MPRIPKKSGINVAMTHRTKTLAWTMLMLAVATCPALAARNVFKVSWHGKAYTTDANGRVVARQYSQKEIIERYAVNLGVDPRTITLAYVRDDEEPAEEIEIVNAIDGSTVANVFQFLGGLAVSTADGTHTQRQRFIYDEDHRAALGNVSGSERFRMNADGVITSFFYSGRFEFNLPEENTVFIGTFTTGKKLS
jgi:hypothetical protein